MQSPLYVVECFLHVFLKQSCREYKLFLGTSEGSGENQKQFWPNRLENFSLF